MGGDSFGLVNLGRWLWLLDEELGFSVAPVVVLEPAPTTAMVYAAWATAIGTLLAALIATVSVFAAARAQRFARQETQLSRAEMAEQRNAMSQQAERAHQLEAITKIQAAAADTLTAGAAVIDRKVAALEATTPERRAEAQELGRTAAFSFEGKAQVLGAHFPDMEPYAYAVADLAKSFMDKVGAAKTTNELSLALAELRIDLGPFVRSPTDNELEGLVEKGIAAYERIRETREQRQTPPST